MFMAPLAPPPTHVPTHPQIPQAFNDEPNLAHIPTPTYIFSYQHHLLQQHLTITHALLRTLTLAPTKQPLL